MNYNPYAAPSAGAGGPNFGPQQQAGTNEPQAWGPVEVTQTAWDRLKPHWLILSLMVFVMTIISQVATQIPQGILKVAIDDPETQAVVGGLASLLILPLTVFLNAGLRKAALAVARGGAPNFGDLFGAGSAVPALLLYEFLPTLFIALVAGAGAAVALMSARHGDDPSVALIGVGVAVLLLAPLVLAYALILWPFPYLVIDRKLPIGEAFREAARISKGSRLNFILLGFVGAFVGMIGACACGVGIFPATALITLASTIAYLRAAGQDSYNPGMGFYPPDMGGFELARYIREHTPQAYIPIVVVSGSVTELLETRGMSEDVTDYFDKSLGFAALGEFIRGYVSAQSSADGQILYVEDSKVVALATRRMLEKYGLKVTHVVSVEDALALVETAQAQGNGPGFDLVLTDVYLKGGLTGKELLEHARGPFGYSKGLLPILVMTADDNPANQAALLRAGANDLVSKPVEERLLITKLLFQLRVGKSFRKTQAVSA